MRKKLDGGARILLTRLQARGYGAYIVGGAVRDMLRGATPHDYDIATSAVPAQTRAVFTDLRTYDTGAAHGTVGVIYDGKTYEITTFRRDGAYSDGRRPDAVEFTGDLCEDLARRDFTVNAMAMDADGRVCDPFSGKADLSARRIRCVGDPDRRFAEDGLRLLRALRLAAQLDFTIEANTAQAMRRQAARLGKVSAERKWTELSALLKTGRAGTKTAGFPELLAQVVPGFSITGGDSKRFAAALDGTGGNLEAALALLADRCPEPYAALAAMRLPKMLARRAGTLCEAFRQAPPQTRLQARICAGALEPSLLPGLLLLWRLTGQDGACLAAVMDAGDCVRLSDLALRGGDLAGHVPQRETGRALRALLRAVMEDRVENARPALLAYLDSHWAQDG